MDKQKHILVVDDEASVRNTLEQILKNDGFRVSTAAYGEEGLELLSILNDSNDLPDLVLSDQRMPGMTGVDYLTKVRKEYPDIIRMLITAYSDETTAIDAIRQAQVHDYIRKIGEQTTESLKETVIPSIKAWLKKEKTPRIELNTKSVKSDGIDFKKYIDVPCILGNKIVHAKGYGNGVIPIKDFATGEVIAYMPNITDDDIREGLEWLHLKATKWNTLSDMERCERIAKGIRNLSDKKYDNYFKSLIPKAGGFSYKVSVAPDRKSVVKFGENSVEYMKYMFGQENVEKNRLRPIAVRGKEGYATLITESMVQTTAYAMISALRASALFHKYDTNNPFTALVIAHALRREGVPVSTFAVDTSERPYTGKSLIIDNVTRTEFMGLPSKLFDMYYEGSLKRISADAPSAKIEILKKQLAMPNNVDYFTAHLGQVYIHDDVDLNRVIPETVYSIISHPRSCKRALNVVFHPSVYEKGKDMLTNAFRELKVSHASNPEADIVLVSNSYWEKTVGISIEMMEKNGYGDLIHGAKNKFDGKLVEINMDALNKPGFAHYASRETMYAYANVFKGDEHFAIKLGKMIAGEQPDNLILTSGIFANDEAVYNRFRTAYFAYDNNWNIATTRGLGGAGIDNVHRFMKHQGIALEERLFRCDS